MTRFRFPLERVLELRRNSEMESAKALAAARAEADAARQVAEDLAEVKRAGLERVARAHDTGRSVGHLQNLALVVSRMDAQIDDALEKSRVADERVQDGISSFREAFVRRKSIDQLKERQRVAWQEGESQSERKTLDEAALVRHARRDDTFGSPEGDR